MSSVVSTDSFSSGDSVVAREIDVVSDDDIVLKFEFRVAISSVAAFVSVDATVPPPNMFENTLGAGGGVAIDYLS